MSVFQNGSNLQMDVDILAIAIFAQIELALLQLLGRLAVEPMSRLSPGSGHVSTVI